MFTSSAAEITNYSTTHVLNARHTKPTLYGTVVTVKNTAVYLSALTQAVHITVSPTSDITIPDVFLSTEHRYLFYRGILQSVVNPYNYLTEPHIPSQCEVRICAHYIEPIIYSTVSRFDTICSALVAIKKTFCNDWGLNHQHLCAVSVILGKLLNPHHKLPLWVLYSNKSNNVRILC